MLDIEGKWSIGKNRMSKVCGKVAEFMNIRRSLEKKLEEIKQIPEVVEGKCK